MRWEHAERPCKCQVVPISYTVGLIKLHSPIPIVSLMPRSSPSLGAVPGSGRCVLAFLHFGAFLDIPLLSDCPQVSLVSLSNLTDAAYFALSELQQLKELNMRRYMHTSNSAAEAIVAMPSLCCIITDIISLAHSTTARHAATGQNKPTCDLKHDEASLQFQVR